MNTEQERKDFEAWYEKEFPYEPIPIRAAEGYFHRYDNKLWKAYQAGRAALQSHEVQAWKRDAERYRATRAGLVGTDPEYGSRFCKYCDAMGIKQAESITEEQFDAATDAAMEKQP